MKNINPFNVDIPDNLHTRKSRVSFWILWQVYVLDLGRGHVLGKFTQLFTEAGLLILILDKVGMFNLSLLHLGIIICIGFIVVWFIGFVYQYMGLDKINNLVVTRRNPIFKSMHERLGNEVDIDGDRRKE